MHFRFLTLIDLFTCGLLGAAAGERWLPRLAFRSGYALARGAGAVLGAVAGVSLLLLLAQLSKEKRKTGPPFFYCGSCILLAAAGSIIAARLPALLFYPSPYPISLPWNDAWPALHFLGITLFAGLVLTLLLARILQTIRVEPHIPETGPRQTLIAFLLPVIALALVHLRWGFLSFKLAMLATMGAIAGLALAQELDRWARQPRGQGCKLTRGELAAGLVVFAGLLLIARYVLLLLPAKSFQDIFLACLFLSAAGIFGAWLGAGLAPPEENRPRRSLGLDNWQVFSGSRAMMVFLLVSGGALLGGFVTQELRGSITVNPILLGGAAFGGLISLLLSAPVEAGEEPIALKLEEGLALIASFLKAAIPVGLILFSGATLMVPGFKGGGSIVLLLTYGPFLAGSLALAWRVHQLYHPVRMGHWLPFAWGWAVTALFTLAHQDVLAAIFDFPTVFSTALHLTPLILLLLALKELLSKRPESLEPLPAPEPVESQNP